MAQAEMNGSGSTGTANALVASVNAELRLGAFVKQLEKASPGDLLDIAKMLARSVIVVHPAAIRLLVADIMKDMEKIARAERGDELLARLAQEAPHLVVDPLDAAPSAGSDHQSAEPPTEASS